MDEEIHLALSEVRLLGRNRSSFVPVMLNRGAHPADPHQRPRDPRRSAFHGLLARLGGRRPTAGRAAPDITYGGRRLRHLSPGVLTLTLRVSRLHSEKRWEVFMAQEGARDQINIFLSYARADGAVHAKRFFDELSRSPRFTVQHDRQFPLSQALDRSIEAAISGADVMIIILTDAAAGRDWMMREIAYAQRRNNGKQRIHLIVAQMTERPDVPVRIADMPRLNFRTDPEAWAKLHEEVDRESLPANGARPFETAGDTRTDERRAAATREATDRATAEQRRAADVPGAADRLRERVAAELRREQSTPSKVHADAALLTINEMPELPAIEFQDRVPKLNALDGWLRDPGIRAALVTGGGGSGKTAFLREYHTGLADGAAC
jgi:hypothetical protein